MNKSIIINQVLNDCVECGTINNHRIIEKCIKKVFQVLNFNNDKRKYVVRALISFHTFIHSFGLRFFLKDQTTTEKNEQSLSIAQSSEVIE